MNRSLFVASAAALLAACGAETGGNPVNVPVPATYSFESRFTPGASSVAYAGQTFRLVLIQDLKARIGGLTKRIDDGAFTPAAGDVTKELNFYVEFDAATSGDVRHGLAATPGIKQKTYKEIQASGAKLLDKIAGNDAVGQHKDWKTQLRGWTAVNSAEALVRAWIQKIDQQAVARANGTIPRDPGNQPIGSVAVTAEGQDLQQLLQKFLDGAIGFSQAADKYLDDDVEGKGLLSDNAAAETGKPYSTLEHAWDEGFGYFGAARNYGDYTDDEVAAAAGRAEFAKGYNDANKDGSIDLLGELNLGISVNAAKRDRESKSTPKTDFSGAAFAAFLKGRAIIHEAKGPLSAAWLAELKHQRDLALEAWEKTIAATCIHYLNQMLRHMNAFGTTSYKFADHAKHWSELKGFALTFQFNRRSPMAGAKFDELHAKLGDAPVLPGQQGHDAYRAALQEAKELLRTTYGFEAVNTGDATGTQGW